MTAEAVTIFSGKKLSLDTGNPTAIAFNALHPGADYPTQAPWMRPIECGDMEEIERAGGEAQLINEMRAHLEEQTSTG